MKSERRHTPVMKKDILSEIILNGGENRLRPERRFGQTVYFTLGNKA
jgi:hypothetical protein